MTKRIFRSILGVSLVVLLASLVLIVGVLHGYGSREELEQSGACAVVRDARELEELLLTM